MDVSRGNAKQMLYASKRRVSYLHEILLRLANHVLNFSWSFGVSLWEIGSLGMSLVLFVVPDATALIRGLSRYSCPVTI